MMAIASSKADGMDMVEQGSKNFIREMISSGWMMIAIFYREREIVDEDCFLEVMLNGFIP